MLRVLRLSMWILTIPVAWSNTKNVYKLDVISDVCVFFEHDFDSCSVFGIGKSEPKMG